MTGRITSSGSAARNTAVRRHEHNRVTRTLPGLATERLNRRTGVARAGRGSPVPVGAPSTAPPSRRSAPRRTHEESPPTLRAGDRAQARSGRPLALEQKRDPPPRPMRRAGRHRRPVAPAGSGSAGARTDPQGKGANPPRAGRLCRRRAGTGGTANPHRCKPAATGSPETRRALSRMPGRNRRGLTILSRSTRRTRSVDSDTSSGTMRARVALLVIVVPSGCAAPVDTGPFGDDYASRVAIAPRSVSVASPRSATLPLEPEASVPLDYLREPFPAVSLRSTAENVLKTYAPNPSSNRKVPSRWTTSPSTSSRESAETSVIMSRWTAESLPDSPSGRFAS